MTTAFRACLASAAIASAAFAIATPAVAGGFGKKHYGSTKDFGYIPPRAAAGPCYVRGDIGGSFSAEPGVSWPVHAIERVWDSDPSADGVTSPHDPGYTGNLVTTNYTYLGDRVSNVEMDDSFFGDIGFGCGSGSKGFRIEGVLTLRGSKDITGEPRDFTVTNTYPADPPDSPDIEDPLHTSLTSHTLMANFYYDLGEYYGFVPYVGAGVGVAFHDLDGVYFTENPFLTNTIAGNRDYDFAWSVMAGFAYQMSDRAVIDVGYRYIDMGSIESGRVDDLGYVNPAVQIDDIAAHEIKVGLRWHFGSKSHAPAEYIPMK